MAYAKNFKELMVWQKARLICQEVYHLINSEPCKRDFALREQLNRSSGSVMDNIAEGFDRDGKKEFIHFLSIAKGSAAEAQSQIIRAHDRGYLTDDEFNLLEIKIIEISKMIGGLMKYLRQSDIKGAKFRNDVESFKL